MNVLQQAKENGHGIGAFNVILLEHAEAIVAGAEAAGLPVILQISQNCVQYHGSLEPILAGTLAVARNAQVPTVVHLDHAEDEELVQQAVRLGVHSVMFDASSDDYEVNVRRTAAMAEFCHAEGVPIEAELGEVGGKDGVHAPGVRTDPADAQAFVQATGVDSLAVAVGSSHAMTERTALLDLELLAALAQNVPVPLVLHGSSGVSDEQLADAVRAGLVKVNISTHLNGLFTRAIREKLAADERVVDPRKYIVPGRIAVADEVERLLLLLARP
ncbi:class II fructose-bisphosphate aldolase [Kineosporia babensis]|uniref:Class II fructose-bisphosphate aldolase family protein n=1 Tax=Kineosporia babensis TaxID=499548 RepID=A0A9X1NFW1_9ACTN|nr:class II fructose-bisphosphate aldolase [Kineosporia babensis]MCD5314242.1 class II fructose-bisphosphate aldolase family protein [Kineosporia babensis]